MNSEEFDTLFEAGSACIKAGDFAQARTYFAEAALIDPDHAPTKQLLEKLELLAPAGVPDDDDDVDDDDDARPLFSLDGAVATQPAPTANARPSVAKAAAADDESLKEDISWSDSPTDAPSSTLAPGATIGVLGGETPLGRKVLSALSSSSFAAVSLAPSYTASMAKIFDDAEALLFISASAGGSGGVEPQSMKALLGAIPTTPPMKRLLLLSSIGVERTDKLPFNMGNVFGQLDKVRAMEQELQLAATRVAASSSVVRVGKLTESAGDLCELENGDAFQGEASLAAVASLLVESLGRAEVVNATFSAGPPPGASEAFAGWDDEFTKLQGPEVLRFAFGSSIARDSVVGWLRTWARDLLAPGSGLTSPIEIVDVADGALVRFVKQERGGGGAYADRDAAAAKDDKWASSKDKSDGGLLLVAEAQAKKPDSSRVRVRRAEMGDGAVPKPMSEAAVLEKLGRDLGLLDKARGK